MNRKSSQHFSIGSSHIPSLSDCQLEFLKHLAKGESYKEIGEGMNISINSVRTHVRAVYKKFDVDSRTKAVVKFLNANSDSISTLLPKVPPQSLSSDVLICCRNCGHKFTLV